jgi:hypothetical protein
VSSQLGFAVESHRLPAIDGGSVRSMPAPDSGGIADIAGGPFRAKNGKTHDEQMFSVVHPTTDIGTTEGIKQQLFSLTPGILESRHGVHGGKVRVNRSRITSPRPLALLVCRKRQSNSIRGGVMCRNSHTPSRKSGSLSKTLMLICRIFNSPTRRKVVFCLGVGQSEYPQ